jgi:hypothetical protein
MPWEFLIIPLIGFGVWLLSNIFRVAEEAQKNQKPPLPPGEDRPRRGGTDLDRFLQEARQRRQTAQRQGPESGEGMPIIRSPERPPEWTERPPLEAPRAPERRQPDRPRDVPRQPVPELPRPRRTVSDVPQASPVSQPPLAKPVMLELVPDAPPSPSSKPTVPKPATPGDLARAKAPAAPASAPPSPPAPAPVTTSRDQGPSPVLLQVARLLRGPQTAGTGFVLREILDRPLCRRRR